MKIKTIAMNQPELGARISEIRNQKGITQKELSEASRIDIRTIQRIEAGEVTPRASTLRMIADALSADAAVFNGNVEKATGLVSGEMLLTLFLTGIVYLFSWILFSPIGPKNEFLLAINLLAGVACTVSGVFFYYAFYELAKMRKNLLMQYSSLVIMISMPLFLLSAVITTRFSYSEHIMQFIVVLTGINSLVFGTGLLKAGSRFVHLYRSAGLLQLVIAPFFIIPIPVLSIVGCWLTIPFILLLIVIVFCEYRESKTQQFATHMIE
jgi:transcriptional regulator with XRE-family HTH domain